MVRSFRPNALAYLHIVRHSLSNFFFSTSLASPMHITCFSGSVGVHKFQYWPFEERLNYITQEI